MATRVSNSNKSNKIVKVNKVETAEVFKTESLRGVKTSEIANYLDEAVEAYNDAYSEQNLAECKRIDESIDENIKHYSESKKVEEYRRLLKCENPMVEACKQLTYSILTKKVESNGWLTLDSKDRYISLKDLDSMAKGHIGVEKTYDWTRAMNELNVIFIARAKSELEPNMSIADALVAVRDCILCKRIGREVELGEIDPDSNTFMLKRLRSVIAAMIGEEFGKPSSHDVRAIDACTGKLGKKAMTIEVGNSAKFELMLMMICHGLIEKKHWETVYKK